MPDDRTVITHVDAMLKLLAVMAKDRRYEEILESDDKKEVGCMCDVAERLERRGIEKGRLDEIFDSVQAEDYSVERGAQKANMSIPEFEKQWNLPDIKFRHMLRKVVFIKKDHLRTRWFFFW